MQKRDLKDIEKNYRIYKDGQIQKISNDKYMSHNICRAGYHRVHLTVNGKRKAFGVHRLVALKFVSGKTKNRNEVNHIDGDKDNNTRENLEWCTRKENMDHARYKLKKKMHPVADHVRNEMIVYLCKRFKVGDVARLLGTTSENISGIKNT